MMTNPALGGARSTAADLSPHCNRRLIAARRTARAKSLQFESIFALAF
jgi:hypothetical protein